MTKLKDMVLKVVGVTFFNKDGSSRQEIISKISLSSFVELKREPNNEYDPNAIAVFVDGFQVGFLSGEDAQNIAIMMDSGIQFNAVVEQIGIYKGKNYFRILVNEV
jgi:HIRAN domain